MAKYHVVFNGEFDSRIGREECIRILAERMGKDEQTVARRFFDSPPQTILETSRKSEAKRAVKLFGKAGAVLELRTDTASGPGEQVSQSSKRSPGRLLIPLVLVLAVVAGLAWYTLPLWYPDEQPGLAEAEAAFATEDLVALGYVDVRRSVAIEQRFLGEQDADALPDSGAEGFVNQLIAQGISPRESVDSVLLAGYARAGEGRSGSGLARLEGAAMVTGEFDTQAVRAVIAQRYQLVEGDGESNLVRFTMLNEQTCEQSGVIAVYVASDRVVIAPQSRIRTLLTRLGASAKAERNLEQWRSFRSGRLASVGLLAPQEALAASGTMPAMVIGKHRGELEDIEALFLGLGASVMPPGIRMTASASSQDTAKQQSRKADIDAMLTSAADQLGQLSPDATRLISHIEPFHQGEQLGATLSLDDQFMEDIGTLAKAGLGALLQPMGMTASPTTGGATVAEQVEENPRSFHDTYDPSQAPPFDAIDHETDNLAWQQGPFALRVKEVGQAAEQGSQPYITLELEARQLQNVPDSGQWGQLRITDVLDAEGNPVMPKQACGQNRNQDPAWLGKIFGASYFSDGEFVNYPAYRAQKQVNLLEGTSPLEIGEVRGVVEARVPVQISRHRLTAPLAGKVVETAGARVRITGSSDGQLSYETSGDQDRILAVRALNEQGQVLKSPGGSSMGRLLGSGKYHSRDVRGNPAQVEVIVAERFEILEHDFRLQAPSPVLSGSAGHAPLVEAAEEQAIREALAQPVPEAAGEFYQQPKASVDTGPVKVSLEQLQSGGFYPFYAVFDIRTARIPGLDRNMAAGELRLNSVTDDQGKVHPLSESAHFALKQDGMLVNGVYRTSDSKPWLEGEVRLLDQDYEGSQPVSISGQVQLAPVREIRRFEIQQPGFGTAYTQGEVSVTLESLGSQGLTVLVTKGAGRLVALEVLNSRGDVVGRGSSALGAEPTESGIRHRVPVGDRPAALVLYVANGMVQSDFPFTLKVD